MAFPAGKIIAVVGVATLASLAHAQLVAEGVEGTSRICAYNKAGSPTGEREILKVGIGQPCPYMRPLPEPEPPQAVPFMAQFSRQRTRGNQRICIYTLAGREYEHALPLLERCPITPYFNR